MSTAQEDPTAPAGAAAADILGDGKAAAEHIAGEAAERIKDAEERLSASAEQNFERIKAYVRKNPMASAGIAFLAGLVISSLIRR